MSEPANSPDDETLVRLCRGDNRQAFGVLVERYWDPLYGWLYRMTRSTHLAEDLTQETFYKAWAGLPSYRDGPGFRAWLFRIARNAWIDHGRRTKRATVEPLMDVASSEQSPLEKTLYHEREALLTQAIDELPDEFREALLLRSGQSLTFAEIANVLGSKEYTVRWRVYKARQLLLKKMSYQSSREELPS